ncbi:CpsB/CapC family capsule biosynthesis tyrosine phosphatase [uncultured Flavobacterium sp.]|uniref:tyrosine-protein phosphatase n=1 Tax=uncultured Flavobacterium sp. TaxID=165435 RepID=UPI0025F0EA13|nr:CpsB/CapC family capsule biosynthesis tyrosine phosphatase [uncultured Flavobacterium sp.]
MFFFNKPKDRLADLIPDGYTDIHSHLLPGIDDGATDEDNSLFLVSSLKNYGFAQFITTPHVISGVWNNTQNGIIEKEHIAKSYLNLNGVQNPFKAAAEYMMDDSFYNLLKAEKLLTLKENYVLVEMSYINPPMQLYEILFDLQIAGYKPVLAHPERYNFYHHKFGEYQKLKKAGCLFQVNLLSLTGYYGKPVLDVARKLLESNMIDFAGSDTHHERHIEAFKNPVKIKQVDNLVKALNNNSLFSE